MRNAFLASYCSQLPVECRIGTKIITFLPFMIILSSESEN